MFFLEMNITFPPNNKFVAKFSPHCSSSKLASDKKISNVYSPILPPPQIIIRISWYYWIERYKIKFSH